jgi:hypothetical protein
MANDNSQKNILSTVVEPIRSFFNIPKRSISAPSEGSQGHSSKSPRKLLSKFTSTSLSQSTLSLPLTSSTEYPLGEIPLGKYRIFSMYILNCDPIVDSSTVTAPDAITPNRSSLMMDSSQYPDHRTPRAPSGSHPLATSPALQSEQPHESAPRLIVVDLDDLSPLTTTSSTDQSPGENTFTSHVYQRLRTSSRMHQQLCRDGG